MSESILRTLATLLRGVLLLVSGLGCVLGQTLSAPTDLKDAASEQAKTIKSAPANTPVKLIRRQGFWTEIELLGSKGWVKLSSVQLGSGAGLAAGLDTGRTGKGNIVSTSAARGLSSKDLTSAKPDFNGFEQLRKLSVSPNAADAFAQSAQVQTRSVALLSAPPSVNRAGGGVSGKSGSRKKSKAEDEDNDD